MNTKQLRQKILDLAIRGKLVPQDPNDEPASALLQRVRAEKERLITEGKIKRDKSGNNSDDTSADRSHYRKVPEGWEWATLGSLGFYKKGPFGSSITKAMFVPDSDTAIKIYEQKNAIYKNDSLGTYFISPEKFQELKGFEVFPDDIIVSCAGTIGETYIMPQSMRRGVINQALMRIMLYDKNMTNFYLMYFDFILKENAQKESKGTAIKNIPPFDVLKQFMMPIPPICEQKRIVDAVNRFNAVIDDIENSKSDTLTYIASAKQKILSLAIRGKLVPQDPNDEPASVLLERIRTEKERLIKAGKIKRDKGENAAVVCADKSYYRELPEGWEVCKLDEVLEYEQPTQYIVESTNYSDGYDIPVLTAGKSFIIGYTNEQFGICSDLPVIIFDDFTTDSRYIDFPFKVKSSAMKILRAKWTDMKYLYYVMQTIVCNHTTHKRYWISDYSQRIIAIPPLAEQQRIVSAIESAFKQLDSISTATIA